MIYPAYLSSCKNGAAANYKISRCIGISDLLIDMKSLLGLSSRWIYSSLINFVDLVDTGTLVFNILHYLMIYFGSLSSNRSGTALEGKVIALNHCKMEKLSVDALSECLVGHLTPDLIKILKDQRITGSRFMALSESTLKLFDFNLCHILDIMGLINEIKTGAKDLTVPSGHVSSNESDDENNLSASSDSGKTLQTSSANAQTIDPEMVEADALLRQYAKASYVDNLSAYELLNSQKKCFNWLQAKQRGFAHSSEPNLALPDWARLNPKAGKENSPPKKKSKNVQPTRRSVRSQLLKPPNTKQVCNTSGHTTESSSKSRHQLRKPQTESMEGEVADDDDDEDDDNDDGGGKETSAGNMYKIPDMDHFKTGEELSRLHPELPSFDVEDILLKNDKTKEFVPFLKEGYLFIEKIRKLLFRTVVRHICFKYVEHPTKVTGAMKEGLAKYMLVKFPQFQKLVIVENLSPWSHITAHFQNVYKRVLDKLPLEERPRKGKIVKKPKKKTLRSDVDIKLLAVINPDSANKSEILDGMKKTLQLRNADRLKGDSITELIGNYPHLINYHGEVISLEFELMYPKAFDMVRIMTPLVPKVLERFCDARTLKPKCCVDEMKVFLYLASQLPHCIDKDAPPLPDEEEIVVTLKVGTKSIEEFVEERRAKARSAVQPYLVAIKGNLNDNILKYFLILDSFAMELGNIPFLRAVDWLCKSYHVFNVHYPMSWRMFFRFLQTCLYKVFVSKNDDVLPSAQNLYAMLLSLS